MRLLKGRPDRRVSFRFQEGTIEICPVDQQDIAEITTFRRSGDSLVFAGRAIGVIEAVNYETLEPDGRLPAETQATIKLRPLPVKKPLLQRLFG